MTLMLVSERPLLSCRRCILCTCNNRDRPNMHYLTHLTCPLGVSPTITCFIHLSHRSCKGSKRMTPVATPLSCFSNFMESCSASAKLKWIYDLVVDILACRGSINLLRERGAIYRQWSGIIIAVTWGPAAPCCRWTPVKPDDGWLISLTEQHNRNNFD